MRTLVDVSDEQIERAADLLRSGSLVAFPTETVYGLGADASNVTAIRKVFAAKQRPNDHPLIVHISGSEGLEYWADSVPRKARLLADSFWPGPLTLVLPCAPHISPEVTGGQTTVALRVPAHPVAQRLLRVFDGGIVAPSANRFGRLSPTTAAHVREELGDAVAMILDGGGCSVGIESTIVALLGGRAQVLRPGAVTAQQIEDTLEAGLAEPEASSPRVPGALASHYAPQTPLIVVDREDLEHVLDRERAKGRTAVLARHSRTTQPEATLWQVAPESSSDYARQLYALLRTMDAAGCRLIVVEAPPDLPEWTAVRDRLSRAATENPSASA